MYNLYMNLETFIMSREMKKIINYLGKVDILIDFDAGATKYIEKIKAEKKVAWIHNSIPKLKKKKSKIERFGRRLEKYDKIVAICDEMKEELKKIYPNLKNKITRIYNPFNFDRIKLLENNEENLSDREKKLLKDKYIVAIARLDNVQKDFNTLIKAFKILKEKGNKEKLYIIGDGPDLNRLRAMIEEYRLEQNIILLGERLNPLNIEKKCDIFFLPSYYEGKPMAVTEAQMLGLVPLITRFSSADEVVDNNINGIICDNSENGILLGLNYAIENIELVRSKYKCNVLNNDYTNVNEFRLIEDLFKSE